MIESHVNNLSSQIGLTVHFNCSMFNLAKKVWQLDTKKLAGVEFRLQLSSLKSSLQSTMGEKLSLFSGGSRP